MLFFVWLKFNDAQKGIGFKKYKYFFFHLSLWRIGFLVEKIAEISSYGHLEAITWAVNLHVNKMADYKSISTHIYYWPTRRS